MTRSLDQSSFAAVIFGLLASLAFYGWLNAVQRKRAAEAEADARQVRLDSLAADRDIWRDSAQAATAARARADARAVEAEEDRDRAHAALERSVRALDAAREVAARDMASAVAEQDSAFARIVAVLPDSMAPVVVAFQEGRVREREAAAARLRATEETLAATSRAYAATEATVAVRTEQLTAADRRIAALEASNGNLEAALALQVQQTETWQRAAQSPGFFEGFGRSLTQVVTAAALGFALGAAAGG